MKAIVVTGLALCGCSSKPERTPQEHRGNTITACSPSSPGSPGSDDTGCHADADCKDGENGRCNRVGNGHAGYRNECGYDRCLTDADCTGGGTCQCTGGGNYCRPGNCRRDADCSGGLVCSPTPSCPDLGGGNRGSIDGFYCHTSADTCVDDKDCRAKG